MVANNNLDLSALDKLSPKEKEYALKVLSDLAEKDGSSQLFNELKYVFPSVYNFPS